MFLDIGKLILEVTIPEVAAEGLLYRSLCIVRRTKEGSFEQAYFQELQPNSVCRGSISGPSTTPECSGAKSLNSLAVRLSGYFHNTPPTHDKLVVFFKVNLKRTMLSWDYVLK